MRFLVLGAGRMGLAVVYDLLQNRQTKQIVVVDSDSRHLDALLKETNDSRVAKVTADVGDCEELSYLMSGTDVIISCMTSKYNYELAKAAMEAGAHFCDLGGNEDIVRKQFLLNEMAREKNVALIPDCGLAPGMVSVLVAEACGHLDNINEIRIRVGGLPVEPRPPLNYSLFFSVEGLINEYVEDATAIRDGRLVRVPSLHDVEEIEFPAPFGKMEAFNTSGGCSTLPTTYGDRVRHLDYKSIRYPGHCEMVRMLKELGLMDTKPLKVGGNQQVRPRAILANLLERKLPKDEPDVVLLRVSVTGTKDGEDTEAIWECIDYMDDATGLSAMSRMTAFPISIIAQMVATGEITHRGTLTQEIAIPSGPFLERLQQRGVPLKYTERKLAATV